MKLAIHNNKPEICENIIDEWIDIDNQDIKKVSNYMTNNPISIINGGILNQFEEKFAEMFDAKYAVAFCNGTAALHAASFACGANKTSNFITSAYSYHGTVNSLLENASEVYLCDYSIDTLNLDCDLAEPQINNNTLGIIIPHSWGNVADMDKINQLKNKYNLKIISDASHAHGAKWNNNKLGSLDSEDISCFSLGKNKLISGGELGVATTNNPELYDALHFLGHPNRVPTSYLTNKFVKYSNSIGNKYRPHPLSMVIALNQMEKFYKKIDLNIWTNKNLCEEINKIPGFKTQKEHSKAKRVYWKLIIKIDEEYWDNISFKAIIKALIAEGLQLEQFHEYDINANLKLWSFDRYNNLVSNKTIMKYEKKSIILPGYISLSSNKLNSIINCFKKVSEYKNELI